MLLHEHNALVPWIWGALFIELIAAIILVTPLAKRIAWLNLACVLAFMALSGARRSNRDTSWQGVGCRMWVRSVRERLRAPRSPKRSISPA